MRQELDSPGGAPIWRVGQRYSNCSFAISLFLPPSRQIQMRIAKFELNYFELYLDPIGRVPCGEDSKLRFGFRNRFGLEDSNRCDPGRGFQQRELEGVQVQRTVQEKIRIWVLVEDFLHNRRSGELEPPGSANQTDCDSRPIQLFLLRPVPRRNPSRRRRRIQENIGPLRGAVGEEGLERGERGNGVESSGGGRRGDGEEDEKGEARNDEEKNAPVKIRNQSHGDESLRALHHLSLSAPDLPLPFFHPTREREKDDGLTNILLWPLVLQRMRGRSKY